MKKLLSIIILFHVSMSVKSQETNISTITDNLMKIAKEINADDSQLVSYKNLNRFFSKKVAYYLSGSSDLSLFNNYAVLDFGDDKATIGWNINSSKKNSNMVTDVFTISLQSAVIKNFAILFSNKKLNNDLGVDLKYTKIFKGGIGFDNKTQTQRIWSQVNVKNPQKSQMNYKRLLIVAELNAEIQRINKENEEYFNSLREISVASQTIAREKETRFNKMKSDAIKKFYDRELEELENDCNAVYNKASTRWISFSSFIPITKSTFTGTTDLAKDPVELVSRKWKFAFSYSSIKEFRKNKLFFTIGADLVRSNSIDASLIDEVSIDKYKLLSQNIDTSVLAKLNSESIYLGAYEQFWTPSFSAQVVFYPNFSKNIGIDLSLIKKTGKDQALDFILGLPIALTSQDGEKPYNIILQARFKDINNKILPEKSISEKIQIGFKVGLPFNSIMKE